MERLTKTYSDGTHGASDSLPCGESSYDYKNLLIEKLGKYEDLEEQDRLIKLPCKIGTEVYDITCEDDIEEKVVVKGKAYYRIVRKHKVTKLPFTYSDIDDFGKTIFLTKSEAEQKLNEMECD